MADLFILRPGIWLMRRLRFSAKLALLAGVAVLAQMLVAGVQGLGSQVHWWVSGLAVLAVVYLAVALRISVIQDMRQLSMSMHRAAHGDLCARVQLKGADELAHMGLQLDRMVLTLSAMVADIRSTAALVAQ